MAMQTMERVPAAGGYQVHDKFPGKEFSKRDKQRLATQISRLLNRDSANKKEQ